jgi:hypothetical protein
MEHLHRAVLTVFCAPVRSLLHLHGAWVSPRIAYTAYFGVLMLLWVALDHSHLHWAAFTFEHLHTAGFINCIDSREREF